MGHVDHGKTTLLSALRETDLTRGEHGGISQHIGAYRVKVPFKDGTHAESQITFIDTPGHAAFSKMRARGAGVTDIVVLVVAANEGVKPQTKEALEHARAANVPIIVAINKIDLPQADVEKTKKDLVDVGLTPEEWGGDTVTVEISAKTKKNLDQLLEMILLVAEMEELKADPQAPFEGVVIESRLDDKRGPLATVLVRNGSLHVGDEVVSGAVTGRVKAMVNDRGERVKTAPPSTPVEILGLNAVPEVGAPIAAAEVANGTGATLKSLNRSILTIEDRKKDRWEERAAGLNVVLKSDVEGTLEAIKAALAKVQTKESGINILHAGTGDITESDVRLAQSGNGVVLGFNVKVNASIKHLAKSSGVKIRLYNVIYELWEDAQRLLLGFEDEKKRGIEGGRAEVIKLFTLPKSKDTVIGSKITAGALKCGDRLHVLRDGEEILVARIKKMEKKQKEVSKAGVGEEVGILLSRQTKFRVGDKLATV
jgi:translation initiation factor IF-2